MHTSTLTFAVVALVAVAALVAMVVLGHRAARRRHAELVERFGPEYERVVDDYGNTQRAERELDAREKRVRGLHLRSLDQRERQRFTTHWNGIQASFFDNPAAAARKADDLIKTVVAACGYEPEHFEQRVADLSVEHAAVIQHYRAARALASANQDANPDVDELRQAILHYRALFVDLLAQPEPEEREVLRAHRLQERHAH